MKATAEDPEVKGMEAAYRAFAGAPYEARSRMREWLSARLDWEDRQVFICQRQLRKINGDGWQDPLLST